MKRFVILAAPRTGSNLLCTLLQSHPDVLCHHEIFNPDGIFVALPLRNTGFTLGKVQDRDNDPMAFLEQAWKNHPGYKHVGFKMTHRQQPQVLHAVCQDPGIHKIILQRKARLKTYVSTLIAEHNGIWEDYRKPAFNAPPLPVEVDHQRLQSAIKFNEGYYAELDTLIPGPRTNLTYEHLFEPDTQQRLLQDLGLCGHPLTAASRQQNPYPLTQLIANQSTLFAQLSQKIADKQLLEELANTNQLMNQENRLTN